MLGARFLPAAASFFTQAYDPATNQAVANPQFSYDANGNEVWPSASYDGENRMTSPDGYNSYVYDPSGKRVWANASGTLYFYDIFGKQISTGGNVYFGSRLVVSAGAGPVVTDRLGSVRVGSGAQPMSYLPYGVEQTSTPNGQVKFGTYLRDGNGSTLGADYADQRYYNPWFGRFNSPDPSKGVDPTDPGSWNKYAYVGGDPINFRDPAGTCKFESSGGEGDDNCQVGVFGGGPAGPPQGHLPLDPPRTPPDPDVVKGYGGDFTCSQGAKALMKDIESNFASFANYEGSFGPLGLEDGTVQFGSGALEQGNTVSIHSTVTGPYSTTVDTSVKVGRVKWFV